MDTFIPENGIIPENIVKPKKGFHKISLFFLVFILISIFFILPPEKSSDGVFIKIENGSSLISASEKLKNENIIRSKILFQAVVIIMESEKKIIAGEYYFDKVSSVFRVARMISIGDYNIKQIKLTIPEGFRREEMTKIFEQGLSFFSKQQFLEETKDREGYLFPDTYFFSPNTTTTDIVLRMSNRFKVISKKYESIIVKSGRPLHDIVTMASIVEKEGINDQDRPLIAGVLWKRLSIDMPLQVDATFLYINGKGSSQLTKKDLAMDHAYNTYKNRGLPPGPIGSPGEASIKATLSPEKSEYLYYLHDKNGVAHFSETYEEHLKNKRKYLD